MLKLFSLVRMNDLKMKGNEIQLLFIFHHEFACTQKFEVVALFFNIFLNYFYAWKDAGID